MEGVAVLDFFQDNWMETREAVVTALKEHFKPGMRVLVTGHSLGGAVAALCAFDLITSGYVTSDELYLYTFGEPRLGNHKFAYTFDDNVPNAWRLIHHDDLIPHIPLKDMLIDHYLHHSREIWYNEAFTNYTVCGPNEDDNCAEGLPFWDWKVSDHDWYFNYGLGHHTLCNW
jgi:predicted lipase